MQCTTEVKSLQDTISSSSVNFSAFCGLRSCYEYGDDTPKCGALTNTNEVLSPSSQLCILFVALVLFRSRAGSEWPFIRS